MLINKNKKQLYLPTVLLSLIASFMVIEEKLFQFRRVCKEWKNACEQRLAWNRSVLSFNAYVNRDPYIDDIGWDAITTIKWEWIHTLYFDAFRYKLLTILPRMHSLEYLIVDCYLLENFICSYYLRDFLKSQHNLQHLYLHNLSYNNPFFIDRLIQCILQTIKWKSLQINIQCLHYLHIETLTELTKLHLECFFSSNFDFEKYFDMKRLCNMICNMPQLTHLILETFPNHALEQLLDGIQTCHNIKHIECRNIELFQANRIYQSFHQYNFKASITFPSVKISHRTTTDASFDSGLSHVSPHLMKQINSLVIRYNTPKEHFPCILHAFGCINQITSIKIEKSIGFREIEELCSHFTCVQNLDVTADVEFIDIPLLCNPLKHCKHLSRIRIRYGLGMSGYVRTKSTALIKERVPIMDAYLANNIDNISFLSVPLIAGSCIVTRDFNFTHRPSQRRELVLSLLNVFHDEKTPVPLHLQHLLIDSTKLIDCT